MLRTDGMAPFGTYLWNDPRIRPNDRVQPRNILTLMDDTTVVEGHVVSRMSSGCVQNTDY